ncbi:MAG: mechanosensitive ion channel [Acidobacteriota bacterium]|jgi:small-conductance mechanosensitive channel
MANAVDVRMRAVAYMVAAATITFLALPAHAQEPPATPGTTMPVAQEPPTEATPSQQPAPQTPPTQPQVSSELPGVSVMQFVEALPESEAVDFRFNNRFVAHLRARVLGRDPADRVATAVRRLNEAIEQGGEHEVDMVAIETGYILRIDGESVLAITPQDLDPLSSDTTAATAEAVLVRLQQAVDEAVELRNPRVLLAALARSALATLIFCALIVLLLRARHRVEAPLIAAAHEKMSDSGATGQLLRSGLRIERWARRAVRLLLGASGLAATYLWLTYSLRQFPYTRPWGEVLGTSLLSLIARLARGVVDALPGLLVIVIVVLVTRLLTRLARTFFDAVRDGRIRIAGLDPDAARPTRQIVIAVLWIFALVVCYPYLPGSESDAFRGVSVFIGVILSIGSTGIVNQAMSGLILMYSAALKPGEYVRVGDVEGVVMRLGMLSTRIRTLHREMVSVPNSVVLARETTNYSRLSNNGVAIKTGITLGYDIPWRQVHAILRLAAERTEAVRDTPAPVILQTALSDFYVSYLLVAYIDEPRARPRALSELHGHILDLCNEHGVQILSPHFVADPEEPVVVPRERWAAAPATLDDEAAPPIAPAAE